MSSLLSLLACKIEIFCFCFFKQKFSKNSKIEKYCYNLKQMFSCSIQVKIELKPLLIFVETDILSGFFDKYKVQKNSIYLK